MVEMPTQQERLLRAALDATPSFMAVVDRSARIVLLNRVAEGILGAETEVVLRRFCGDVLNCSSGECGTSTRCQSCRILSSVQSAWDGTPVLRNPHTLELRAGPGQTRKIEFLITATPLDYEGERLVALCLEDVKETAQFRKVELRRMPQLFREF